MSADSTPTGTSLHPILDPQYQLERSPVYRAVWEPALPLNEFRAPLSEPTAAVQQASNDVVDVVQRCWHADTARAVNGHVSETMLGELAGAGYWALGTHPAFGGLGATFHDVCACLTRLAARDTAVAGLGILTHGIGPANAIRHFGSEAQQRRWLPALARGDRRAALALTEPAAGTDLAALRTTAIRDGRHFVVDGEKAFISNLGLGRLIALACQIEGQPQVLICELPERPDEHVQLIEYELRVQCHMPNCGMRLSGFRVPAENLLHSPHGGGLAIVYHGLNRGRISLAATAAGSLRRLLADMTAWVQYRVTHGKPLAERGLIQHRLGRLASLIVACDAIVDWSSALIDRGYRGELEATIAKVFASDALREATVELAMKTHGGRAFLAGHGFADHALDYLATSIYEGEGEVLSLALMHTLWKRRPAAVAPGVSASNVCSPHSDLEPIADQIRQAADHLRSVSDELRQVHAGQTGVDVEKDCQCQLFELSGRLQSAIVALATGWYGACHTDAGIRSAADVICRDLSRRLNGERANEEDFAATRRLGQLVLDGRFTPLADLQPARVLMTYEPGKFGSQ